MKKIIGITSLVFILIAFVFWGQEWYGKSTLSNIKTENAKTSSTMLNHSTLSFSVMGDVHTDAAALENALKDIHNINSNMDLLVLNGDIMDEGLDKEYSDIKNSLTKNEKLLPKTIIKNIGNHEFFDYAKGSNSPSEVESFKSKYLTYSGEKKVYHDRWIKGYHFISLGSEETYTSQVNSVQALLSQEQLNWLKTKLSEDYKPGRPILVFLHQTLTGTKQNNELKNILSNYPEIILFSSHTHTFLESNNIAYQTQPFTSVHTGAVHNPLRWEGKGKRTPIDGSQGLYVEIDENKALIKGRDFRNKSWIDDAVFTRNLISQKPNG